MANILAKLPLRLLTNCRPLGQLISFFYSHFPCRMTNYFVICRIRFRIYGKSWALTDAWHFSELNSIHMLLRYTFISRQRGEECVKSSSCQCMVRGEEEWWSPRLQLKLIRRKKQPMGGNVIQWISGFRFSINKAHKGKSNVNERKIWQIKGKHSVAAQYVCYMSAGFSQQFNHIKDMTENSNENEFKWIQI